MHADVINTRSCGTSDRRAWPFTQSLSVARLRLHTIKDRVSCVSIFRASEMIHSSVGESTLQSSKRMKLNVKLQRLGESKFSGALNFVVGCSEQDDHHLIVEKVKLHCHPPAGYVSRLRLIVNEAWKYDLQVLLSSSETGQLGSTD